jgi:hypothetical protein
MSGKLARSLKRRRSSFSSGFLDVDFAIAIAGKVALGFPQQAEKLKQHTCPPFAALRRPFLKMDPRDPRTSEPYAIVIVRYR